jgi:hypothetical protein
MPRATTAFHNRLAVVFDFDFDDTLAPDSYETLLDQLGVALLLVVVIGTVGMDRAGCLHL